MGTKAPFTSLADLPLTNWQVKTRRGVGTLVAALPVSEDLWPYRGMRQFDTMR